MESRNEKPGQRQVARSVLWLRSGDQRVLGFLIGLALALMFWHWGRLSDWGRANVEVRRFEPEACDYRIDINRAHWVQWAQLEGIGPALSRRIVADRRQNGPFPSIDALQRIKGIGPRILERIRPHLECSESVQPPRSAPTAATGRQ